MAAVRMAQGAEPDGAATSGASGARGRVRACACVRACVRVAASGACVCACIVVIVVAIVVLGCMYSLNFVYVLYDQ